MPGGKGSRERERKVGEGRVYMMEKRLGEAIERRGNKEEGEERSQGRGELQKCFGREGRSEESGGAGERCVGGGSKLKGKLEKARLGRGKKK